MDGTSTKYVPVLFRVALMASIIALPGHCSELELPTSSAAEHHKENIKWNIEGNNNHNNIQNSTELLKLNYRGEWPGDEKLSDKAVALGKRVKGFFGGLADFFGGSRKKRSTGISEKLYRNENARLWRIFFGDVRGYARSGTKAFERPLRNNILWPTSLRRYSRPRVGVTPNDENRENSFGTKKDGKYVPLNYETFPKPLLRSKNRNLPHPEQTYDRTKHSVTLFKEMRKLLMKRKKGEVENREEQGQHDVSEVMEIYTWSEHHPRPQLYYKCKAGTKGLMSHQEGRTMNSRGITFSEEDVRGVRTLLCKSETTEVYKPDHNTFVKNSVLGLNIVTNDNNPFKFLERENEINSETLEIGSKSSSELSYTSTKNQSISSVSTQEVGAHAQTKANTKFVYENGLRTALESRAEVDGSTTFNATDDNVPIMLTSRKEESSSILQNPEKLDVESDDKGVSTFMSYKKKMDFDIAFRNLNDYR